MKTLSRNAPRDLSSGAWYYVNKRSVDLVAAPKQPITRLREAELQRMLAELLPKQSKKAKK